MLFGVFALLMYFWMLLCTPDKRLDFAAPGCKDGEAPVGELLFGEAAAEEEELEVRLSGFAVGAFDAGLGVDAPSAPFLLWLLPCILEEGC